MKDIFPALILIGFGIALFLVLRQLVLWYWKVDVIIRNQEVTNKLLTNSNSLLKEQIALMKDQRNHEGA